MWGIPFEFFGTFLRNPYLSFSGSSTAMKSAPKPIISAIETWIKEGMPPHKLNVGFSLYGHTFTLADVNDVTLGILILCFIKMSQMKIEIFIGKRV